MVRFFDETSGRIESKFWNIYEIYSPDDPGAVNERETAEHRYIKMKKCFTDFPLKNKVGFGLDGCNVMIGRGNFVASRFKEDCSGVIVLKCTCKSAHFCASADTVGSISIRASDS